MYASIHPANKRKRAGKSVRSRGDRAMSMMPSPAIRSSEPLDARGTKPSRYPKERSAITPATASASAAMSVGNPNRSTIGPPMSGPTKAPRGFAPFTTPNAKAVRAAGACSASVASMSPVLPSPSDWNARENANTHTFGAITARPSAMNAVTKDRMMSGFRPYRSASAPQNGRNGSPTKFEKDAIAPTQNAISLSGMPRRGR